MDYLGPMLPLPFFPDQRLGNGAPAHSRPLAGRQLRHRIGPVWSLRIRILLSLAISELVRGLTGDGVIVRNRIVQGAQANPLRCQRLPQLLPARLERLIITPLE